MIQVTTKTDTVVVNADNGYNRLQAAETLMKGETILILQGAVGPVSSRYSIQIGVNKHIEADVNAASSSITGCGWRYLNHSCQPNAYIRYPELHLVASRDIKEGEELFFDYNSTEYEMAEPFECNCGGKNCLGLIRGYKYLNATQRKRIASITAPHLLVKAAPAKKLV